MSQIWNNGSMCIARNETNASCNSECCAYACFLMLSSYKCFLLLWCVVCRQQELLFVQNALSDLEGAQYELQVERQQRGVRDS